MMTKTSEKINNPCEDHPYTVHITVQQESDSTAIPDTRELRQWVLEVFAKQPAAVNGTAVEICVRIVDEEESAAINDHWRGKKQATNVLSFPMNYTHPAMASLLGDLVICAPVIEYEAIQQGKQLSAHWAHMIIHGVLHLLGFDHVKKTDALHMEKMEVQLLHDLGFPDPYQI